VNITCKYIQLVAHHHAQTSPKPDETDYKEAWMTARRELQDKIPGLWTKCQLEAEKASESDDKADKAANAARKRIETVRF
jgi:hypothetical protein